MLDVAAEIDPSKLIVKQKYHLLTHLRADIIRFGPLIGVATETFESYNSIFRHCSILSNHKAPSRDIAYQLAEQETVKHLLSGGWWLSAEGNWKEPGPGIRNYISGNPILRTLCGWTSKDVAVYPGKDLIQIIDLIYTDNEQGTIKLKPIKRNADKRKVSREAMDWEKTQGARAVNSPSLVSNVNVLWYQGKHVVSKSLDECKVGSWVYALSPFSVSDLHLYLTDS